MVFGQSGIEIVIRARDEFSATFNRAAFSMQKFQKAAVGMGIIGAGIAVGFGKALKTSIDFESAFTGVRKTVELSEAGFADLEQKFKDLTKEIPLTFVELSKIGEIAGQLGVEGVDNIAQFTKTIADISVTTNLTAEQAATDFARFANIMDMPIEQVDRLGSVIVDLGNNLATTESEILEMGMRIAGAGKALDFTEGEVMAWAGALSSVGIQAQMGGTAISKFMINVSSMVSTGSEDLFRFAEIAGMTTDEFTKAFKENASDALQTFFNGLGRVKEEGGDVLVVLEELGITEVRLRDAVLRLAGSQVVLNDALGIQGPAWEENTASVEEAEKRYSTLESQITIAKNEIALLGDEIGDRLAPMVQDSLIPAIKGLTGWFTDLNPEMQDAILIIAGVTGGVFLLAAAVALLMFVLSPILLIIGGIVILLTLLGIGIYKIAKKIESWKNLWLGFKNTMITLGNIVLIIWNGIVSVIEAKINRIVDIINWLIDKVNKVTGLLGIPSIPDIPAVNFGRAEMMKFDFGTPAASVPSVASTGGTTINIETLNSTDPLSFMDTLQDILDRKITT